MFEPDETPKAQSRHLIPSGVFANVKLPPVIAHAGPTRKGHSNGLRVHAILFGTMSTVVVVVLTLAFIFIAGGGG